MIHYKVLLAPSIILLLFCGCRPEAPPTAHLESGGTLVIGMTDPPSSLNPLHQPIGERNIIVDQLFLRLHRLNERGELEPQAALRWEFSEDLKEITYTLCPNLQWWDGIPVTAQDVEFAYQHMLDPTSGYVDPASLQYIDSVRALDERRVTFFFKRTYPRELLDSGIAPLPTHILSDASDLEFIEFNRNPIGNGPFKLATFLPDHRLVLSANPTFYAGRPPLNQLAFWFTADVSSLIQEIDQERVDIALDIPASRLGELNASGLRVIRRPGHQYLYIGWNLTKPIFTSRNLRHALSWALNRSTLIDDHFSGYATPSLGPLTPASWAYDSTLQATPVDTNRARQLLIEDGWVESTRRGWVNAEGTSLRFELLVNEENPLRRQLATSIQNQLQEIGVRVTIQEVPTQEFIDLLVRGDFDAYLSAWNVQTEPRMMPFWHSDPQIGRYNLVSYANPVVDSLLAAISMSLNRATAKELWREFQRVVYLDQPYSFLIVPDEITVVGPRVHCSSDEDLLAHLDQCWIPAGQRKSIDLASLGSQVTAPSTRTTPPTLEEPETILEAAARHDTIPAVVDTAETVAVVDTTITTAEEPTPVPEQPPIVEVVDPSPLDLVQPVYPPSARAVGAEGTVFVEVLVAEDGSVREAAIVRSFGHPACNEAAITAALQSRFEPGKRNGEPAEMRVVFPYRFVSP